MAPGKLKSYLCGSCYVSVGQCCLRITPSSALHTLTFYAVYLAYFVKNVVLAYKINFVYVKIQFQISQPMENRLNARHCAEPHEELRQKRSGTAPKVAHLRVVRRGPGCESGCSGLPAMALHPLPTHTALFGFGWGFVGNFYLLTTQCCQIFNCNIPVRCHHVAHFPDGETVAERRGVLPTGPSPTLTHHHDVELEAHLHGFDLQLVQHGIDAHVTKRLTAWGHGAARL